MKKYEIELQRILSGDKAEILNATKLCNAEEKKCYFYVTDHPFFVQRSPGSLGVDLLVARGDITFLIEVKSSIKYSINLGSNYQLRRQYEKLKDAGQKYKLLSLYAYRMKNYKGDSWRLFAIENEKLEGRSRILFNHLPKVNKTKNEVPILKFKNGLPLFELIRYICR